MRRLAILLPLFFTGCGGDGDSAAGTPPSLAAVKTCLEGKGLQVLGGTGGLAPDDTDAPDRGELITGGAFIAFYSSEQLADKRAKGVEANAKRSKGTIERVGAVTVVYIDTQSKDEIDACLDI